MATTRLLLYCHNVLGLGHIVRSLRIAAEAARLPGVKCCVITGCAFLDSLEIPVGVAVEQLPPAKLERGFFVDATTGELSVLAVRSKRILAFTRDWEPDAVLVDHLPLGLGSELLATLTAAHTESWATTFVLGCRDIQLQNAQPGASAPRLTRRQEIAYQRYAAAIAYSDARWIDGFSHMEPSFNPELQEHVGVVTMHVPPHEPREAPPIVVLAGGGAGGAAMLRLVAGALRRLDKQDDPVRVVAGPLGDVAAMREAAGGLTQLEILATATAEDATRDARCIIARCGYNTAYSVVQRAVPVIFVPYPQAEQHARARRMATLDRVWSVDEEAAAALERLAQALDSAIAASAIPGGEMPPRSLPFRLDGAATAARRLLELAHHNV